MRSAKRDWRGEDMGGGKFKILNSKFKNGREETQAGEVNKMRNLGGKNEG